VKSTAILFFLSALPFFLFGQEQKTCRVIHSESGEGIRGVHIQNLSKKVYTVSNESGNFILPIEDGDSLWFSSISYKSRGYIIQEEWAEQNTLLFELEEDTVLLNEITIHALPSERMFKQQIMDYQPLDTMLTIFGLPEDITLGYEGMPNEYMTPSVAGRTPFGMLYSRFSKAEKEKRKMGEILQNESIRITMQKKYNREIVTQLTGLQGDQLTNFMDYCDFSDEFLIEKSAFQIAEMIVQKYQDFKKTLRS
jgi:hypothetical protein